jgi:hypothetical protein
MQGIDPKAVRVPPGVARLVELVEAQAYERGYGKGFAAGIISGRAIERQSLVETLHARYTQGFDDGASAAGVREANND